MRERDLTPRGAMSIRVDAYTSRGKASGLITRAAHIHDALEGPPALLLEQVTWQPLDMPASRPSGEISVPVDDVLLAVADDDAPLPVHHAWHPVTLEAGPYAVEGELPTLPGFDPGRALTRPSGEFVLLRDVRIRRLDDPDGAPTVGTYALVNRYGVERVTSDLMLGYFFPGAAIGAAESPGQADQAQAGASAGAPGIGRASGQTAGA